MFIIILRVVLETGLQTSDNRVGLARQQLFYYAIEEVDNNIHLRYCMKGIEVEIGHIEGQSNRFTYLIQLQGGNSVRFSVLDRKQSVRYEYLLTRDELKSNQFLSALFADSTELMECFLEWRKINKTDFIQIENSQTAFISFGDQGDKEQVRIKLDLKRQINEEMRKLEEKVERCQEQMMEQIRSLQSALQQANKREQILDQQLANVNTNQKVVDKQSEYSHKMKKTPQSNEGNLSQNKYVKFIAIFVLILFIVELISIKSALDNDHFTSEFNQNVTKQLSQFKSAIADLRGEVAQMETKYKKIDLIPANRIDQIEKFLIRLQSRLITVQQHYYKSITNSNNKGHHHNGHQKPTPPPRHYSRHY